MTGTRGLVLIALGLGLLAGAPEILSARGLAVLRR